MTQKAAQQETEAMAKHRDSALAAHDSQDEQEDSHNVHVELQRSKDVFFRT